jgi:peptidoglycan/xylan/chitin deacetylase (PgdA/CDA1 family)
VNADNVKQVSDALTTANIPATLFVYTKDVGLNGITEKMLLTLMANGFDVQSAGHTGDDLRALTNAQVGLELKQSREILEQITHKTVYAVLYPQGGTNDRVMQLAAEAGYLFGISNTPDREFTRDEFLRLPSFAIFPTATADDVVRMVKGS